ncbi:MAG TPA: hypothetical protein P5181_05895 [Dermatophilaceae bacterium]|nr:hypothetical protein [Dermatophilaceae bacterium]
MTDGSQYEFAYYDTNVYGHVFALVDQFRLAGGSVHLDLGCGFGAIAERCRDAGLDYVGLDVHSPGLDSLRARGFETGPVDLQDVPSLPHRLREALGDRRLASISLIDVLEHVTTGWEVLDVLARFAAEQGGAPLVVAVPNVSHRDLGAKLLVGRWDYTETGLLDRTHVIHHTEALLTSMTEAAGWREAGAKDFRLDRSDQHFPADLPVLGDTTTVGAYLTRLADSANPLSGVNELVRVYVPGRPARAADAPAEPSATAAPFLSVVMRTQGRRAEPMRDALMCLVGQANQDFELIVLAHKVSLEQQLLVERLVAELPGDVRSRSRVVVVDEGGRARPLNVGVELASGRYIAFLDDDDLVLGHWVDEFAVLAQRHPGRVLRAVSVIQPITTVTWPGGVAGHRSLDGPQMRYSSTFDLADHFYESQSPLMSLAYPRSLFTELRMRFDESLDVMEDWDFLLRAAMICGVAQSTQITSIYRRWESGEASHTLHSYEQWQETQRIIIERLDREPQLLPPGTIRRLLGAGHTKQRPNSAPLPIDGGGAADLAAARREIEELRTSTSWRATAGLRMAGRMARRARSLAARATRASRR